MKFAHPSFVLLLAAPALLLAAPAGAEFTTQTSPEFRGDEGTAFYGWTDWDNDLGGVAFPDDPGSTSQTPDPNFAMTPGVFSLSSGPLTGLPADQICEPPGFASFGIGYSAPAGREVLEVVLQLQGPGVDGASVILGYTNAFDPDYLSPVEVVQLAPNERLYRFLAAPDGLPFGTVAGDLRGFQAQILFAAATGGCLDAVRLDVRTNLDGAVDVPCITNPNSLGVRAGMDAGGSSAVADNNLRLTASGIRPGEFGIFLTSQATAQVVCPGGCGLNGGVLCLGGAIGRFPAIVQAGSNMSFDLDVDLSFMPVFPGVAVTPGDTWYFQAWFRDSSPILPVSPSNLTNPIGVTFH